MKSGELTLSNLALAELLQATLSKGVSFRFKVKGFSMLPFIRDCDVLTISPQHNSTLGLGKSVAFIHPETGKLVIHRVVSKKRNYYLIKGDSVPKADALIPKENVLGVVTKLERNGKKILFGFGPERFLIALLSRLSLFYLLLLVYRPFRPLIRRFVL